MEARGERPSLPPVTAQHVVDWWLEIGPTGGEGAICWQDMAAWERMTGVELEPWEAKAIRAMSVAFVNQRHDSRKSGCPSPIEEGREQMQARVDTQFAAMMKAFAPKPKSGK